MIVSILLGFETDAFSQSYSYRHFTVEDGLPTSEVFQVFQDSKGYIWIATNNGVCRYDGYEFKTFTKADGLPDDTVLEIYEDHKNRIWFIPHSVKLSYYFNDSIIEYKYNDAIQKLVKGNGVPEKLMFYVDSIDNIYIRDRRAGTFVINSAGFVQYITGKLYGKVFLKKENKLFLKNKFQDSNISNKKNIPYTYRIVEDDKIVFSKSIASVLPKNYSLLGYVGGVIKDENSFIFQGKLLLHIKNNVLINVKFISDDIIWISTDNIGKLWVGTRKGAYCYNDYSLTKKPEIFLKDKAVSSVLQDNEGGYWFSTLSNGVFYLPNIQILSFNESDNPLNKNIFSITSDSVNIWLGLSKKIIGLKENKISQEIELSKNDLIIYKLFWDYNNQSLWIGASGLYQQKHEILKRYELTDLSPVRIRDVIIDNKGTIWAAAGGGLCKSVNKHQLKWLYPFRNKINSFCQMNNNKLLLGCNNGLWEYSKAENTFIFLGNENNLLKNKIKCLTNNPYQNTIWIGTSSEGVLVYGNDSIYRITVEDGLSNNSITSFYPKDSVMWVSTVNGLNKISFYGKSFKNYKIECLHKIHGIASNEINDLYVGDSLAYVATKKGLTVIDYKNLKPNNEPPPVFIKGIAIMGKDTLLREYYELPYDKNSIRIEFVGLMYKNIKNKKYKYKLSQEGEKADWTEISENYVKLSFLPHGKYTFMVKAINEDNTESIDAATISFTISPPIWKTRWFILLVIIIALFVIYLLYKTRIRELNKRSNMEKQLLQEVYKFRQQALSQQMNPHFIFNTLNSIQYYIYENDSISSGSYLTKFSKLMRLILDNSQHETISIQKELDAMDLYLELETLRLEKSFDYKIIVDKKIDTLMYQIYPLLIQPYVENSIWHGLIHKKGEKRIKIELSLRQNYILCIIEDNGIGREKAMEIKKQKGNSHKSHGTNITGKRINLINKLYNRSFTVEFVDLKDETGNASGTRVLLLIPKILN